MDGGEKEKPVQIVTMLSVCTCDDAHCLSPAVMYWLWYAVCCVYEYYHNRRRYEPERDTAQRWQKQNWLINGAIRRLHTCAGDGGVCLHGAQTMLIARNRRICRRQMKCDLANVYKLWRICSSLCCCHFSQFHCNRSPRYAVCRNCGYLVFLSSFRLLQRLLSISYLLRHLSSLCKCKMSQHSRHSLGSHKQQS